MTIAEINRITRAHVLTDCMVEIEFSDGLIGRVDLGPAMWGPVFEPLKDPDYFRQMRIEDETIRWPNGADFCPDVLRYWCDAGGVRSQEETDSHFARILPAPSVF